MHLKVATALAAMLNLIPSTQPVQKGVAAATHGEATVYVASDFTRDFDVAYSTSIADLATNNSFTTVGLLLIGASQPGPYVSVGLSRGYPARGATAGYVLGKLSHGFAPVEVFGLHCASPCLLELRGTRNS